MVQLQHALSSHERRIWQGIMTLCSRFREEETNETILLSFLARLRTASAKASSRYHKGRHRKRCGMTLSTHTFELFMPAHPPAHPTSHRPPPLPTSIFGVVRPPTCSRGIPLDHDVLFAFLACGEAQRGDSRAPFPGCISRVHNLQSTLLRKYPNM